MEKLNEQNEQYIINTIQDNSKQKDKKITKEVYNYFFSQNQQIQQLIERYNLNNFIISDQKTELNYYFYYFHVCTKYQSTFDWCRSLVVRQFNSLFISLNYLKLFNFFNVLQFSLYKYFNSLVNFLSISFFLMIHLFQDEIVFIITSLDCSLLMYTNVTDFCILTLLNQFVSYNIIFSQIFRIQGHIT